MFIYGGGMQSAIIGSIQKNSHDGDDMTLASHGFNMQQSDNFSDFCAEITQSPAFKKFCEQVNEKIHTAKAGDTTYRIINHWTQQGLFDDERAEDSMDWRKLSLKDVMWLRMARDLRKFGLPLDKLRVTYQMLWKRRYQGAKRVYPWLEIAIALCKLRVQVVLVVLEDGYAEITTPESLELSDMMTGTPSLIRLNVNNIWREIVGDKDGKYIPTPRLAFDLKDSEIDAYAAMHNTDTGAVQVHLKDGHITRIDTSKQVEGAERIVDILKETHFGEITMKVENGKAVHTQMVKKEKPRK